MVIDIDVGIEYECKIDSKYCQMCSKGSDMGSLGLLPERAGMGLGMIGLLMMEGLGIEAGLGAGSAG